VKRTGERHYLCRMCGGVNDDHGTEVEFQRHLSSWPHRSKIMQREALRCKICDIQCKYPSALASHIRSKAHLRKENPESTSVACEACGVRFRFVSALEVHQQSRAHLRKVNPEPTPPLVCDPCGVRFRCQKERDRHLASRKHATHTTTPRPGYCEVCARDYRFPSQLQIHLKSQKHARTLSKTNSCTSEPDQSIPLSPSDTQPCLAT
jgi:hypothetical protein